MSDGTKIEWAEASLNPIRARNRETEKTGWFCSHVSDGCVNCYSETLNRRLGTGVDYRAQNVSLVDLFLDEQMLTQPLRWKRGRRIFWNSMTDTFGEFVPAEWIDRMFAVMALTPQHKHLVLTKRHERMQRHLSDFETPERVEQAMDLRGQWPDWPIPNVHLGVSVEDQRRANERIPALLDTPAAVRWVSAEPLLGPISLRWLPIDYRPAQFRGETVSEYDAAKGLNWIVIGGESGPGARPFNIEWARSIIAQCKAAGVACFVKQLGAHPVERCREGTVLVNAVADMKLRHRKGGDISEFPEDLRIREYPK